MADLMSEKSLPGIEKETRFCCVIYTDQILYYLHMGLHNRNSPWQCNLCGVTCSGVQDFTSHVIHY